MISPIGAVGAGSGIAYIPRVREKKEASFRKFLQEPVSFALFQRRSMQVNMEEIQGTFATRYGIAQYRKISIEIVEVFGMEGRI